MIEQGLMVMIAGMVTVFFFLVVLALMMMLSRRIIRCFSSSGPFIEPSPQKETIAAIVAAVYSQSLQNSDNEERKK